MPSLYVSPSGSDQNTGTQEAPLQTLSAARVRVRQRIQSFAYGSPAEDIVEKLEQGTHRLTETLVLGTQDGGNVRFHVIWQGDPDAKTLISSGVPLNGWKRCEDNLADLPHRNFQQGRLKNGDFSRQRSANIRFS